LGVASVIPLAESNPDLVRRALRLKKLGNELCETLVGRKVHAIGMIPGGFLRWPDREDLKHVGTILEAARDDLEETLSLFRGLHPPQMHRTTEYIALRAPDEYALYTGQIASSLGEASSPRDYRTRIKERVVCHSSAKHATAASDSYAVGALARFNLNHRSLHPRARQAAEELRLQPPVTNPFHNNTAQLVEVFHCHEEASALCNQLLDRRGYVHRIKEPTHFGRGVGATEVPRGTLYHEYTLDRDGRITEANCVIPTGQNLANIESDMRGLVEEMAGGEPHEIQQRLEMLVRAYDPCISCSSHFLDVRFE
jgi:coenzyme F420-reducing hydrogenase alpha subunit